MSKPFRLGRYLITQRLAVGGMSEVFLGTLQGPEKFQKRVAVKQILPQWSTNPEFVSMLIEEAKLLVELTHPNIVQVIELGEERGTYFIAMEYVEGIDLRELLKKTSPHGGVPLSVSLAIAGDCLSALAFAHSKGVIHRDISPQNILLSFDGVVKITDFGIAKLVSRNQSTTTGVLKGKFPYMSPEQAMGKELDHRTDLFSMGVVLFELLTGRRLYKGRGDLEVLECARRAEIRFLPEDQEKIPKRLQEILLGALQRDPQGRFKDAPSFREAVLRFSEESGITPRSEEIRSFLEEQKFPFLSFVRSDFAETRQVKRPPLFLGTAGSLLLVLALSVLLGHSREGLFNKERKKQTVASEKGAISVQALPWGLVTIDSGRALETPVQGHPLEAGRHRLTVSYEPENRVLSAMIDLKEGQKVHCLADFQKGEKIRCR